MARDAFFAGPEDDAPRPSRGDAPRRGAPRGRGFSRGGFRGGPRGASRGAVRGGYQSRDQGWRDSRGRGRGGFSGSSERGRGGFSDSRGRGSDRGAFRGSPRGRGSDRGASRGSTRGRGAGFLPGRDRPEPSSEEADETERPTKRMRQSPKSRPKAKPAKGESDDEPAEPISIFDKDALDLSCHPLPAFDDLVDTLSQFKRLRKLNVGSIEPNEEHPQGLDSLAWLQKAVIKSKSAARKAAKEVGAPPGTRDLWFGHDLTTLTISGNHALGEAHSEQGEKVFSAMTAFPSLFALDLSSSSLRSIPLLALQPSLRALVLTGNELTTIPTLPLLPNLNTLIVSKNKVTGFAATLPSSVPALKKLSLANNDLSDGEALPDFSPCGDLREVRLNGNAHLRSLPSHLATWGHGRNGTAPGLDMLDLGRCGLESWDAVAPLMRSGEATSSVGAHRGLRNLNLHGNPLCDMDDPTEAEQVKQRLLAAHPGLRTLNNDHVGPSKKGIKDLVSESQPQYDAQTTSEVASSAGQKRKREEESSAESKPATRAEPKPAVPTEKEHAKHKRGARGGKKKHAHVEEDIDATTERGPAPAATNPPSEPGPEPEVEEDVKSDSEDEAVTSKRTQARAALAGAVALEQDESDDELEQRPGKSTDESYLIEEGSHRKDWVDKTFDPLPKKDAKQGSKGRNTKATKSKKCPSSNLLSSGHDQSQLPTATPPEDKPRPKQKDEAVQDDAAVGVVSINKKANHKKRPANDAASKPRHAQAAQFGLGGGDAWGDGQSSW